MGMLFAIGNFRPVTAMLHMKSALEVVTVYVLDFRLGCQKSDTTAVSRRPA